MRTILLPSWHLFVPLALDDTAGGFGLREVGFERIEVSHDRAGT
jgi:hypothetical protein